MDEQVVCGIDVDPSETRDEDRNPCVGGIGAFQAWLTAGG